MTEEEMVGWHHRLNEHESEQAPGDGEGQGSLACCSPWGRKESDTTERLNNNNNNNKCIIDNVFFFSMLKFYFSTSVAYGGKNKTSLGRSTDELFTEMKKIHNGSNVCELSIPAQGHQSHSQQNRTNRGKRTIQIWKNSIYEKVCGKIKGN